MTIRSTFYSTTAALEKRFSKRALDTLILDGAANDPDPEKANEALRNASDLIDSYLSIRYVVPFADPPPVLKKICEDLAAYMLFAAAGQIKGEDNVIQEANDAAIRFLEKVNKGEIALGKMPETKPGASVMQVKARTGIFTDEMMDQF